MCFSTSSSLLEASTNVDKIDASLEETAAEVERLKSQHELQTRSAEDERESLAHEAANVEKLLTKRGLLNKKRESALQKIRELGTVPRTDE